MKAMRDVRWNLAVTTEPTFEPVTLEQTKTHLREDGNDQDAHIIGLIAAARSQQEEVLDLALCTQTLVLRMDCFPSEIRLPRSPAVSVTSITYIDGDGAEQTMAATDYQVDVLSKPARIVPAYGESWPTTRTQPNAVAVTYVAGYVEGMVPYPLQQALMMRVADLYEVRESHVIGSTIETIPAVDALEASHRVWWF
jgi:uncharacterized phiE125 gp8 family phage protein